MSEEYRTGYGKPPREYMYKKGQSGNIEGRRKHKPMPMREYMDQLEHRHISVFDGGKRKRVQNYEIVLRQLVVKLAKGDISALAELLAAFRHYRKMGVQRPVILRFTGDNSDR